VYDLSSPEAGYRVLVDRLWPRGRKREAARTFTSCSRMSLPSEELRRWFGHDPARWEGEEFQARPLSKQHHARSDRCACQDGSGRVKRRVYVARPLPEVQRDCA
jgi:uncharacterized protein YeaO (DUF488 family)